MRAKTLTIMKKAGKPVPRAEFTRDMLETVLNFFDAFADEDGVVSIEAREGGLFIETTTGHQQFIGLARPPGTQSGSLH